MVTSRGDGPGKVRSAETTPTSLITENSSDVPGT